MANLRRESIIEFEKKQHNVSDLLDTLKYLKQEDILAFFQGIDFNLPRSIRITALRKTLLHRVVDVRIQRRTLADELGYRLSWFRKMSEFELENLLAGFDDHELTVKFLEEFWLSTLSYMMEKRIDEKEFTALVKKSRKVDQHITNNISKFNWDLNPLFYDRPNEIDGLTPEEFRPVLYKSSTIIEIRELGLKYDVNVPKRLRKRQLLDIMLHELLKREQLDTELKYKLESMTIMMLQRYCKDHNIKVSIELKKEEIIEYILSNYAGTRELYYLPADRTAYEVEIHQMKVSSAEEQEILEYEREHLPKTEENLMTTSVQDYVEEEEQPEDEYSYETVQHEQVIDEPEVVEEEPVVEEQVEEEPVLVEEEPVLVEEEPVVVEEQVQEEPVVEEQAQEEPVVEEKHEQLDTERNPHVYETLETFTTQYNEPEKETEVVEEEKQEEQDDRPVLYEVSDEYEQVEQENEEGCSCCHCTDALYFDEESRENVVEVPSCGCESESEEQAQEEPVVVEEQVEQETPEKPLEVVQNEVAQNESDSDFELVQPLVVDLDDEETVQETNFDNRKVEYSAEEIAEQARKIRELSDEALSFHHQPLCPEVFPCGIDYTEEELNRLNGVKVEEPSQKAMEVCEGEDCGCECSEGKDAKAQESNVHVCQFTQEDLDQRAYIQSLADESLDIHTNGVKYLPVTEDDLQREKIEELAEQALSLNSGHYVDYAKNRPSSRVVSEEERQHDKVQKLADEALKLHGVSHQCSCGLDQEAKQREKVLKLATQALALHGIHDFEQVLVDCSAKPEPKVEEEQVVEQNPEQVVELNDANLANAKVVVKQVEKEYIYVGNKEEIVVNTAAIETDKHTARKDVALLDEYQGFYPDGQTKRRRNNPGILALVVFIVLLQIFAFALLIYFLFR